MRTQTIDESAVFKNISFVFAFAMMTFCAFAFHASAETGTGGAFSSYASQQPSGGGGGGGAGVSTTGSTGSHWQPSGGGAGGGDSDRTGSSSRPIRPENIPHPILCPGGSTPSSTSADINRCRPNENGQGDQRGKNIDARIKQLEERIKKLDEMKASLQRLIDSLKNISTTTERVARPVLFGGGSNQPGTSPHPQGRPFHWGNGSTTSNVFHPVQVGGTGSSATTGTDRWRSGSFGSSTRLGGFGGGSTQSNTTENSRGSVLGASTSIDEELDSSLNDLQGTLMDLSVALQ